MPIREYKCPKCGVFEVLELTVKKTNKHITCEKCGTKSELILSTCSVQFVGSGFYCTDYKNKKEDNNKNVGKDSKNSRKNK